MQISWSYNDSNSLRASWFLDRLRAVAPELASGKCYTNSAQGESSLRMFLDSRSADEHVLVSVLEDDIACSDVEHMMRLYSGVGMYFDLNFAKMALERFAYSTSGKDGNSVFKKVYPGAPPVGDYQARSWPVASFTRAFPLPSEAVPDTSLAFVCSGAQKQFLKRIAPELPSEVLPLPIATIAAETVSSEAQILRQILKYQPEDFVIGITADKNSLSGAEQVLQAVEQLRTGCRVLWLTRDIPTEALAQKSLTKFGLSSLGTVLRLASSEEWSAFHSAFDLGSYLHLDSLAGPTLSQLICLERGVPLLVNSSGFAHELPVSAALKVNPHRYFEETITRQLQTLIAEPTLRKALRAGARAFAEKNSPEKTAKIFLESLSSFGPQILAAEAKRAERLQAAQLLLLEKSALPRGGFGKVNTDRLRLSEIAESLGWNIPMKGQLRGV